MADSLKGRSHKEHEHRIKLVALPKECDGVKPIRIKQGVLEVVGGKMRCQEMFDLGLPLDYYVWSSMMVNWSNVR